MAISTDGSYAEAEHWLKSNMVFGYGQILGDETSFAGEDIREFHLKHLLSGGRVELLVDADADHCLKALEYNVPCLLFGTPKFVRTRRAVKASWQDIQEEVDRQKQARAEALLKSLGSRWE